MNFTREMEMLEPAQTWLQDQGLMTKAEFYTPWGVCDLVGVEFRKNSVKKRLRLRQMSAVGPAARINLLRNIPDPDEDGRTSITLRRLERLFSYRFDAEEVQREIQYLVKNRFVCSPKRNHFQRVNGWMPLQKRIVAVELKLNRITEALHQAACHRKIAQEVYAAFPIHTAERLVSSGRVEACTNLGVGILGVHPDGCERLLKPSGRKPEIDPVLEMHCVERFWRTFATDN